MLKYLILLTILASANACHRFSGDSKEVRSIVGPRKSLRVATVNGQFTYQRAFGTVSGLEADLLQNFAWIADLDIHWQVFPSSREARNSVLNGSSDLAAFYSSGSMKNGLWAGPSYEDAELVVSCPQDTKPTDIRRVMIHKPHDSASLRAEALDRRWQIIEAPPRSLKSLFKLSQKSTQSKNGEFCVVSEKSESEFELQYFQDLDISVVLDTKQALRFWVSPEDPKLLQALYYWNQKISQDSSLSQIRFRYKHPAQTLTDSDLSRFFTLLKSDFLKYAPLFRDAAQEHQLPWQLVAAVAYQESHWNFEAVSFTGVRGLMQITTEAADHMGIRDRRDPEQNVWAGAKYLNFLLKAQPNYLPVRERLHLALASYNVGQGHLRDAQRLAVRLGKNPYSWKSLREVLPLLSNERWVKDLEYGPARGQEAVDFSDRSMAFYDLLNHLK